MFAFTSNNRAMYILLTHLCRPVRSIGADILIGGFNSVEKNNRRETIGSVDSSVIITNIIYITW